VHAVGTGRVRDVGAPVHDHAHAPVRRARGRDGAIGGREQRRRVERAIAQLEPVDARVAHAPQRRVGDARERGAVEHPAEDRGRQKLASPSSGLDAFA
jgi:hypothetical protein